MKEYPTLTNSQAYFKQFRPGNNEVRYPVSPTAPASRAGSPLATKTAAAAAAH